MVSGSCGAIAHSFRRSIATDRSLPWYLLIVDALFGRVSHDSNVTECNVRSIPMWCQALVEPLPTLLEGVQPQAGLCYGIDVDAIHRAYTTGPNQ